MKYIKHKTIKERKRRGGEGVFAGKNDGKTIVIHSI